MKRLPILGTPRRGFYRSAMFLTPGAEEALYNSQSMRRFVGINPGEHAIPEQSTTLTF